MLSFCVSTATIPVALFNPLKLSFLEYIFFFLFFLLFLFSQTFKKNRERGREFKRLEIKAQTVFLVRDRFDNKMSVCPYGTSNQPYLHTILDQIEPSCRIVLITFTALLFSENFNHESSQFHNPITIRAAPDSSSYKYYLSEDERIKYEKRFR